MEKNLLVRLRKGEPLTSWQQVQLILQLSFPTILAQLSTILLEFADAAMVGHLGAQEAASIGLVASTTWLFGGLISAAASGYTIQIAHRIGAGEEQKARVLVRHGLAVAVGFGAALMLAGLMISGKLPHWLGGDPSVCGDAAAYFRIFMLQVPLMQVNRMAGGMLQCSGEMKIPGMLDILMCLMNIVFNVLLIFPSGTFVIPGTGFYLPGAGLSVRGAAWGTLLSVMVSMTAMLCYLLLRAPMLRLRPGEGEAVSKDEIRRAFRISVPQAVESVVTGSAYVAFTAVVAPLGTIALAANSFSITAESICYMPGYGIGVAATTLIGQCYGAGRQDLTRRLSWLLTALAMGIMAGAGVLMYIFAPQMIGLLTPDPAVRELGTAVLRIEAFAEPFYAASIVVSGVFRGYGDTLTSSILNLISMWAVRIPLAAFFSAGWGLRGAWTAMCIELYVRGTLFLGRLVRKSTQQKR